MVWSTLANYPTPADAIVGVGAGVADKHVVAGFRRGGHWTLDAGVQLRRPHTALSRPDAHLNKH